MSKSGGGQLYSCGFDGHRPYFRLSTEESSYAFPRVLLEVPGLIKVPTKGEKGAMSENQIISRFPDFIIAGASAVHAGGLEVRPAYSSSIGNQEFNRRDKIVVLNSRK